MSHDIAIIGDGCAALSFAAKANEINDCNITIVKPDNAPKAKNHVWGFWSDVDLASATKFARGVWYKWAIVNHQQRSVMKSSTKPYNAIKRLDWQEHCTSIARSAGVEFVNQSNWQPKPEQLVFDSRPPIAPSNCLLQHFHGIEIKTDQPVFDAETAVLMDFRVDQSRGLHFVYLLPYSSTEALVESTMFSSCVETTEFYQQSIISYLEQYYDVTEFQVTHTEHGIIPLGKLARHDPNIPGIGANGGAIRPASGYAFLFIQRQIKTAINSHLLGRGLKFKSPHRRLDLWMDSVLLTVLQHWPEQGPQMFVKMAKALSGDQFVKFMNGDAGWWIRIKVILAMPKFPFIKALTKRAFQKIKPTTSVAV